ncbi:MAG TPA: prolyl oligopeptidase family serine peptidase [Terracidiphilus sp.]|nr:prolyl oligopeptidase family serine peptidase [Terracidiphilus sp.]
MKTLFCVPLPLGPSVALNLIAALFCSTPAWTQDAAAPPVAPVRAVTTDYFGVTLTDPYRYIENLKDPEVEAWFKGQNAYTRSVLSRIPGRDALLARIKELDQSVPARVSDVNMVPGGRYFYEKMLASEIVSKLYVRDGLNGQERLLLDPAKYPAPEGSHNAISYYNPSFDGKMVAVGVSPGGSENAVIHIFEVDTGKEFPETIDRARFGGIAWRTDNHAFLYNRLQKLAEGQPQTDEELKSMDYLHVVGTNIDSDVPAFGMGVSPRVEMAATDIPFTFTTVDGHWVVGYIAHGVLNEGTIYRAPLDTVGKPDTPWEKVCDIPDDVTGLALHGDDLYLQTHKDAPHFKVIVTSLAHPDVAHAKVVIPESEHVIKSITTAKDALYVQETDATVSILKRVPYDGASEEIKLPFEGAVGLAASDERIPGILFVMTSWARAPRIDFFDPATSKIEDTKLQPLGPFGDPEDVVSEEVKVKSWDGAMVPLSIVHKRGLKMDGSNPALLNGYGAYGISIDPEFDPTLLAWLEKGGVYAWAHPRGGGEYGEDWHKAGEKLTKPNTWRDFIACAEYLIDNHYTSAAKLGGEGTSAGGVTIGRAITERPDLFAAALDRVGMSNAVRSEETPNGPPNIPEFGSAKTLEGFEDLYAMDAYHHVRDGAKYPAVMVTTGWNDPRVASWEPGKMAARLQAATGSGKPILLRVEYAGGHGMGSTKAQLEEQAADEWSFLLWQFNEAGFQPGGNATGK